MRTTNRSCSVHITIFSLNGSWKVYLFYAPFLTQLLWACIEIKSLRKCTSNSNVLYFTISLLFPSLYYYLTVKPFHKSNNTLKGFKLQKDYMLYCLGKALLMPVGTAHCNLILHFK